MSYDIFIVLFINNKALKINDKNSFVYHNRGLIKADRKDFNGAIDDYDKAITSWIGY